MPTEPGLDREGGNNAQEHPLEEYHDAAIETTRDEKALYVWMVVESLRASDGKPMRIGLRTRDDADLATHANNGRQAHPSTP
jgi:hypothetical protein